MTNCGKRGENAKLDKKDNKHYPGNGVVERQQRLPRWSFTYSVLFFYKYIITIYFVFVTSRFAGEFIGIDRNAKLIEDEQVNGVHLVTDYNRVRDMHVLLGRYTKGPLNFFPGMTGISLSMKKIPMLESEPYVVSPKPTGTRFLLYVNASGQIFMEKKTQQVFRVDTMKMLNCDGQPITDTVLDGFLTREKTNAGDFGTSKGKLTFVIMDAIRCNGKSLIELNFLQRIALVKVGYISIGIL